MLKELKKNHHITYLTLDDGSAETDALEKASEYAHETITIQHQTAQKFSVKFYLELTGNLFSKLPYFMQKYVSKEMFEAVKKLANGKDFDVIVCDFLMPAVNMPEKIKVPIILFQHNVEAMIWRRHFEVQKNPLKKKYLKNQWRKSFNYERAVCRKFDFVIAVSKEDADTMRNEYAVENVADVPTGVDTEFFRPSLAVEKDSFNLIFTGSMDWLPNEDGMLYFAREIFPRIRQQEPEATLSIIGRSPTPAVRRLGEDPAIEVTGRVDDVRPHVAAGSVYVVPLRIGGGTRLKIFEAMSMGKAVVSTTVGAEGLPVTHGADIFIADDPAGFADAVVRLIRNDRERQELEAAARRLVVEQYDWSAVAHDFEDALDRICSRTQSPAALQRTGHRGSGSVPAQERTDGTRLVGSI